MNDLHKIFWNAFADPYHNTYPPYNIIKDKNNFVLEFAVAGFDINDLSVEFDGGSLEVRGTKEVTEGNVKPKEYVHKGLSTKDFTQRIAVRGKFEVGEVYLTNGILTVTMINSVEVVKPKIRIGQRTLLAA